MLLARTYFVVIRYLKGRRCKGGSLALLELLMTG